MVQDKRGFGRLFGNLRYVLVLLEKNSERFVPKMSRKWRGYFGLVGASEHRKFLKCNGIAAFVVRLDHVFPFDVDLQSSIFVPKRL